MPPDRTIRTPLSRKNPAAEATKSADGEKIAEWLCAGSPVQTVIGETKLDAKGEVVNPSSVWYTFKDGTYTEADVQQEVPPPEPRTSDPRTRCAGPMALFAKSAALVAHHAARKASGRCWARKSSSARLRRGMRRWPR